MREKIEAEVKLMLHCHRDTLRNQGKVDTTHIRVDVTEGFYGEAFGIMRALQVLGYGQFESSNLPGTKHGFKQDIQNLRWWFCEIEEEVLKEEGFYTDNRCKWCLEKYGKDDRSMLEEKSKKLKKWEKKNL
jgi:hypothetical protein